MSLQSANSDKQFGPGDTLDVINENSVAVRYKIDLGTTGSVIVTIQPGGEFSIVAGDLSAININIEEILSPGIRTA